MASKSRTNPNPKNQKDTINPGKRNPMLGRRRPISTRA
jgi:hypothetical protein